MRELLFQHHLFHIAGLVVSPFAVDLDGRKLRRHLLNGADVVAEQRKTAHPGHIIGDTILSVLVGADIDAKDSRSTASWWQSAQDSMPA